MYRSQIVRISPVLVYCSNHASCLWCGRGDIWHQREQMMARRFSHGAIPPLRTVECSTISILNKLIPCELFWDNICTKQRPHHCEIDSENELFRFHQLNQNLNCYVVFCIWTGYLDVIPFASIPAGPLWSEPSIGLSTELPRLPFTDFSGSTWVSQFKQCRSYLVTSWTTYERWSETMVASPQCARHFWQIHGSIGRQKADCEWGYASWDETKRKKQSWGCGKHHRGWWMMKPFDPVATRRRTQPDARYGTRFVGTTQGLCMCCGLVVVAGRPQRLTFEQNCRTNERSHGPGSNAS